MSIRDLPSRPHLEQYRKQAKDLLKRWKADDPSTARKLADAQFDIAHEHGFTTWKAFTDEIAKRTGAAEKAAIWSRPRPHSSQAMTPPSRACSAHTRRCSGTSGRSRRGSAD